MKKFYAIALAMFYLQYASAQDANRKLSNLNHTTAVNVNLLPGIDNSISLGSGLKSWRHLFLDGAVYLGGSKFISYGNDPGDENTAIGVNVLTSAVTGYKNTGIGYTALYSTTSGSQNTANGYYTLRANTMGSYNTASGSFALRFNTNGNSNTASGNTALYSNTTGDDNTATGASSLHQNTTGNGNTANGAGALYANTNGSNNAANGFNALYNNTTGYLNTANGALSLYANTTGYRNTAFGSYALTANTTGYFNTATGSSCLNANTTGNSNTAIGVYALNDNTTGNYNAAHGVEALNKNTTGSYNTGTGRRALYNNITGNLNTAVGYYADVSAANLSNATAVGYGAVADASNKVRIGNASVTSIGGHVNWTTFSDGRYKKDIHENVKGLAFINALRPVTYTADIQALNAYYAGPGHNDADRNTGPDEAIAVTAGSKIVYSGFIAQEVEAVAKKLGYDFSGVDKPKTREGVYGLRYSDFVVPLVKAVQELSGENEAMKSEIRNLKSEMEALKAMIVSNRSAESVQQSTVISSAFLEQNVPNPFTRTTTIGYSLPAASSPAKIIITDMNGKQVKQFNVSGTGKVLIDASTLASGAYYYSLYADGRLIGSKKMIRN